MVAPLHPGPVYEAWWQGLEMYPPCSQCMVAGTYHPYEECSHLELGCCWVVERIERRGETDLLICAWCKQVTEVEPYNGWVRRDSREPVEGWEMVR